MSLARSFKAGKAKRTRISSRQRRLGSIAIVACANEILNLFEQFWHDEAPFGVAANLLERKKAVQNIVATAAAGIY
jgi:hypothetical protein